MILELDNVELYFKSKIILSGIYLQAESGKITCITGLNGSGKSSLLRIIFGDLIPKYHLLRIDGKPHLKPLYTSGLVKYLPQDHFIPKSLKIREAFQFYKVSSARFFDKFQDFKPSAKTRFHRLSSGERRLIEIYLILKSNNNILLLDQPFQNLSPINTELVKTMILEEKKNKLIIMSMTSSQIQASISDLNYLLENGQLKSLKPASP